MVRDPSAGFVLEKNMETNSPIRLYRIEIDLNAASGEISELFLAEAHQDVNYFKDVNTAQTYQKSPIKLNDIPENIEGQIDSLTVTLSNVSREIQAFLELNDGLKGNKVTIRQVFGGHLADPDAYVEDIFYIDSVNVANQAAEFTLTSKLDILSIEVPRRMFERSYCQWGYKDEGCWLYNSVTELYYGAPDFSETLTRVWMDYDVEATGNPAEAGKEFRDVNCRGVVRTTHNLVIDLKCNAVGNMTNTGYLAIRDTGASGTDEWRKTDLTGLVPAIIGVYRTFTIPLSGFAVVGTGVDVEAINYILWYQPSSAGDLTISWCNAKLSIEDSCDKTYVGCGRHNNKDRFGGFRSVPSRKVIRL